MRRCAILALLSIALIAGCGGGSDTSTGASASVGATAPNAHVTPTTTSVPSPAVHRKLAQVQPQLGSPSEVPRTNGGDNSIQDFGSEASAADRAAAAKVLTIFLQAYAAGDASTACALLSSATVQSLEQSFGRIASRAGASTPKGCPAILGRLIDNIPTDQRRQLAQARVLSVRVDGTRAFAIYDGAQGKAYAMPMSTQAGAWTVAALAGTPLI
jgi:hypothetical protein